jgi:hypothetical protein
VPAFLIRNSRGTNWGSFREDLRERLERVPEMSVRDEAGLGLAVHWVQQALISAYEDNCPLRQVRKGKKISEMDIRVRVPQERGDMAL